MTIATINPATGLAENIVPVHSLREIDRILGDAVQAHHALRRLTFQQRATWMRAAADRFEADGELLARMVTTEMGKPIRAARAEVAKCVACMRFYAANAETMLGEDLIDNPASVNARRAGIRWDPLGVVLAVMPWNYPLWQVIRFAAPALMAGNSGVLKHASNVPKAAAYLGAVFTDAGFPPGAFSTLFIQARAVESIIRDPRIAAVTLTGSEPAGRSVASIAGAEVKKTVLELGGSDPFVVLPSADLDAAVHAAVLARTLNAGQSCIAGKRFIVHRDIYDDFAAKFSDEMASLVVGDPLLEDTDIGPLATESGRDEIVALVDDARHKGATILTGGRAPDCPGFYYPPTVIADVTDQMHLYAQEAFGPVATLFKVESIDHAIRVANSTSFGLSSSVWTNDDAERDTAIRELEAGAVFVNGMSVSYPELPFGGIKNSGYGRELGAPGIREFCNMKTVWEG